MARIHEGDIPPTCPKCGGTSGAWLRERDRWGERAVCLYCRYSIEIIPDGIPVQLTKEDDEQERITRREERRGRRGIYA
jgi:hypothetical protein